MLSPAIEEPASTQLPLFCSLGPRPSEFLREGSSFIAYPRGKPTLRTQPSLLDRVTSHAELICNFFVRDSYKPNDIDQPCLGVRDHSGFLRVPYRVRGFTDIDAARLDRHVFVSSKMLLRSLERFPGGPVGSNYQPRGDSASSLGTAGRLPESGQEFRIKVLGIHLASRIKVINRCPEPRQIEPKDQKSRALVTVGGLKAEVCDHLVTHVQIGSAPVAAVTDERVQIGKDLYGLVLIPPSLEGPVETPPSYEASNRCSISAKSVIGQHGKKEHHTRITRTSHVRHATATPGGLGVCFERVTKA